MALPALLLAGCDWVVMNPSGDIARQQADLILVATGLMLLIIVPVIALTLLFAWKYRQSNTQAEYDPEWDHSTKLELVIWGAPLLIIIVLGLVTWVSTHKLDPYRPLDRIDASTPIAPSGADYLDIQVVALDWKWLFVYPEQGIATVNELVTPVNRPIRFKITSSTVMNSFYVPELAGMIYAMPGMTTTLHAVLNKEVKSKGFSANYSGAGFSQMRFDYKGLNNSEFDAWVADVKKSGSPLNRQAYLELEKPSTRHPVEYFAKLEPKLFHLVVNNCVEEGKVCMDEQMAADAARMGSTEDSFAVLIGQSICRVVPQDTLISAETTPGKKL